MYWLKLSALQHVWPCLLHHGIKPADLLKQAGVPESLLVYPNSWIERDLSLRLAEHVVRITGNEGFGAEVGKLTELDDFGGWGRDVLRAATLGEAISVAAANLGRITTGSELSLHCQRDEATVSVELIGAMPVDPMQHDLSNLVVIRKIFDRASETFPFDIHAKTDSRRLETAIAAAVGDRIQFGADRWEIVFDRSALSLPLQEAPSVSISEQPPQDTHRDPAAAVLRIIRALIEWERPTIAAVADELSMNVRTLQRHLSIGGLSFDTILDEYRLYRAMALLETGDHSITDIAFQLGYSDSAHFTRAMRRWTGCSPRQLLERDASIYDAQGFRMAAPRQAAKRRTTRRRAIRALVAPPLAE